MLFFHFREGCTSGHVVTLKCSGESCRTAERSRWKPWLTGSCPLCLDHLPSGPSSWVPGGSSVTPPARSGEAASAADRTTVHRVLSLHGSCNSLTHVSPPSTRKWAQPALSNPSALAWAGAPCHWQGALVAGLELKKSTPAFMRLPGSWGAVTMLGT